MGQIGKELFGSDHEIAFWKEFVKTERFLQGWCGQEKTPELNESISEFIIKQGDIKILDIGSGACSILNGISKNLIATDPLGEEYAKFVDYDALGVQKPITIAGENIVDIFNDGEFDVVFIRNAFDHSQNPQLLFENMKRVCKEGGHIIISGFENEATFENWKGFHQWNVFLDSGKIRVNGKSSLFTIEEEKVIMSESIDLGHKTWMNWICQK